MFFCIYNLQRLYPIITAVELTKLDFTTIASWQ